MSDYKESIKTFYLNRRCLIEKILQKISEDYKINLSDLTEKYIEPYDDIINKNLSLTYDNKKKKPSNNINEDTKKCLGKVKNLEQCSRKPQQNKKYCKTHESKLPYGSFDISTVTYTIFTDSNGNYGIISSDNKIYTIKNNYDVNDLNKNPIKYIDKEIGYIKNSEYILY